MSCRRAASACGRQARDARRSAPSAGSGWPRPATRRSARAAHPRAPHGTGRPGRSLDKPRLWLCRRDTRLRGVGPGPRPSRHRVIGHAVSATRLPRRDLSSPNLLL